MAFRITNTNPTAQNISAIPFSSSLTAAFECDPGNPLTDVTFSCWYFCEHDGSAGDFVIWETYVNNSTPHFGLYLNCDGSNNYTFNVSFLDQVDVATDVVVPTPVNKWLLVTFTYNASTNYVYLTVFDPYTNTTTVSVAVDATTASSTGKPAYAAIGAKSLYNAVGYLNAKGICIPSILTGVFFADGLTHEGELSTDIKVLANNLGLQGHISYDSFNGTTGCRWATNYYAGSAYSSAADARAGKTANSSNLATFDSGNVAIFANAHSIARGCTIVGSLTSVNPYLYGVDAGITFPLPTDYPDPSDTTVGGDFGVPAGFTFSLAATGPTASNYKKLADWISSATGSGQLRVGFHANSRAVYPALYNLRLSDGTFVNRTMMTNVADMGIIGQAGLWNNGHIIGGLYPIPTCLWSTVSNGAFANAALEGAYGPDCSTELLMLTLTSGATASSTTFKNGLTSMANSTLGSRFTLVSRQATTVPSNGADANNYRGNGCAVRLTPGCKYRIMIRPETGLTTGDPLDVKLHLLNHPSSSRIANAYKVVAGSQSATADSSTSITGIPGMGASSSFAPPSLKAITGITAATQSSQDVQTVYGAVRFDDSNNGFSSLGTGDMMQLYDSSDVSNVYNEAWIVRSVGGKGTSTCSVTYEWLPRQAPIVGDKVTFVKSDEILKTVTAQFAADEAAGGKWRGIEIEAATSGDGLLLWGLEFRNTVRNGVFVVPVGRSGCGVRIQGARWPRIEDSAGVSLNERLFELMDLDVIVLLTADQGNANSTAINNYIDFVNLVKTDTPSTNIVLYSTGPEFQGETVLDKSDYGNKYDYAAVMQYAGITTGVAHTAYLFSRYISAFGRLMTGDDATEGSTHPSTVLDVQFLGTQLAAMNNFSDSTSVIASSGSFNGEMVFFAGKLYTRNQLQKIINSFYPNLSID